MRYKRSVELITRVDQAIEASDDMETSDRFFITVRELSEPERSETRIYLTHEELKALASMLHELAAKEPQKPGA
jgi:hypothetical protein